MVLTGKPMNAIVLATTISVAVIAGTVVPARTTGQRENLVFRVSNVKIPVTAGPEISPKPQTIIWNRLVKMPIPVGNVRMNAVENAKVRVAQLSAEHPTTVMKDPVMRVLVTMA
ncbi:hypothetical protein GCM10028808_25820 [Spirosoma migulaei]